MDIVLLGLPGAGKGTQANRVAKVQDLTHIATGDLFRDAARAQTPLGEEALRYMDQGWLVPDHVTIGLVEERINDLDCAGGCVFDGFPRTIHQAVELDRVLKEKDRQLIAAIFLEVPRADLLRRLSGRFICRRCGRSYHLDFAPPLSENKCCCGGPLYQRQDDKKETVLERLRINQEEMDDILAYYNKQKCLFTVDGNRTVETVTSSILTFVRNVVL